MARSAHLLDVTLVCPDCGGEAEHHAGRTRRARMVTIRCDDCRMNFDIAGGIRMATLRHHRRTAPADHFGQRRARR